MGKTGMYLYDIWDKQGCWRRTDGQHRCVSRMQAAASHQSRDSVISIGDRCDNSSKTLFGKLKDAFQSSRNRLFTVFLGNSISKQMRNQVRPPTFRASRG